MALLGNPFVANVPRQMSSEELAQALRMDMAGELEAIIGYEAHAMATNDERIKKILYGRLIFPSAMRLRCPHVTFSDMEQLSSWWRRG